MGRYLELEDMPLCRACGCAPVIKGNRTLNGCGNTRLQCPECGIRTGQSTDEQAKFRVWLAVMADRDWSTPGSTDARTSATCAPGQGLEMTAGGGTPGCSCDGYAEAAKAAARYERLAARMTGKLCRMCRRCYVPHCDECEVKRIKKREGWRA